MSSSVLSVEFPRITINVDVLGTNSLLGSLCIELQKMELLEHTRHRGILKPEEIVFIIKKVHKDVNVYAEINKVRDILNIEESKITVLIEP
jgi:hypothetical protein